jgi:uncharacterized damage-inducible protein DinB
MSDDFPSLFRYFRWADERLIAECRKLPQDRCVAAPAPGWSSLRSTLVHLGDAADIWWRRLVKNETPTSFRAETEYATVDDVAKWLTELHDRFDGYVAYLTPAQLGETFHYTSMRGQAFAVPRWTVLRHLVNHGTYHRGQAASKIRLLGGEPPATDFILWALEME